MIYNFSLESQQLELPVDEDITFVTFQSTSGGGQSFVTFQSTSG